MSKFYEFNMNPKNNKKANDCVIRAISVALNKSWFDIFDEMTSLARDMCTVLNQIPVINKYLEKYEKIPVKIKGAKRNRYLRVREICDMPGTYVCSLRRHLVCVKDGQYIDTWDCGDKAVNKVWKIK